MKEKGLKVLRVLLIQSYKIELPVLLFLVLHQLFILAYLFTTFQNSIQHCLKKYFYHKYSTFHGLTITPRPPHPIDLWLQ